MKKILALKNRILDGENYNPALTTINNWEEGYLLILTTVSGLNCSLNPVQWNDESRN